MKSLEIFEKEIKRDIPLAEALAFRFVSFENNVLTLQAPYLPNRNDKSTVFAGSLASLALLSGWSLSTLFFEEYNPAIVAAVKTDMHYKKPIDKDFELKAAFKDSELMQQNKNLFLAKGRARTEVSVEIYEQGGEEILASFEGSYFISR